MPATRLIAWLALLFWLSATAWATTPRMLLPIAPLDVGNHRVHAEIAATPESRTLGLMYRESLAPDHGMLFVFSEPTTTCFWMQNTPLPLSIAFIDTEGTILNIRDMQPHTTDSHCPTGAFLYALEMPRGWFRERKLDAGTRITSGLPPPAAP